MSRADREQQMLDVAEAVFASRGYAAASMDDIADEVGVSKPMLYQYFGSKDGLLLACVRRARARLREVTLAAIGQGGGPRETLRRGLVAHFEFVDEHATAWAVLRSEAVLTGEAAAEMESVRAQQATIVAESTTRFVPDVDPTLVDAYAHLLVGATERISVWREGRPGITPEVAADLILTVVWSGVSALIGDAA